MTTQWLNANEYRRYPFIEDEDMTSGGITVPESTFLDFRAVSYVQTPGTVVLNQFTVTEPGSGPRTVTFQFAFSASGDTFSFTVPANAGIPYSAEMHDSLVHHIFAKIGSGISELAQNTPGTYSMDDPPALEPSRIQFQAEHRLGFVTAAGAGQDTLTGHVRMKEGYNCRIVIRDNNHIRIDAARGHGEGISCERIDPDVVLCSESLLRINGLSAGDQGDFMLAAGDGTEVVPDPDNHRIIVRGTPDAEELEECG